MIELLKRIHDAVQNGDKLEVEKLADEVISSKLRPIDAIQKGAVPGLEKLGQDFEDLKVFLPELMLGGEAMMVLINKLSPYMGGERTAFNGKVVIGTVQGDLHDIGKNLVATTLSINSFNVIDLGVDVSSSKFIERASESGADIIAMSSLLTTSAYYIEELINRLNNDNLRSRFKVIVGGGPIDPDWAKRIGADGYAATAVGAVKVCKDLMQMDKVSEMVVVE